VLVSEWGKRRRADNELRMLYSDSGRKRSEPIITKTAPGLDQGPPAGLDLVHPTRPRTRSRTGRELARLAEKQMVRRWRGQPRMPPSADAVGSMPPPGVPPGAARL